MPDLGTVAVNAEGETVPTEADISGGVIADNSVQEIVTLEDEVSVEADVTIAPEDEGQVNGIVVYAAYKPLGDDSAQPLFFMLDSTGNILPWSENVADLVPFKHVKGKGKGLAKKKLHVPMYKGKFILPGMLQIFFGYSLDTGAVVTNEEPVDITIEDASAPAEEAPVVDDASGSTVPAEEIPIIDDASSSDDGSAASTEVPTTTEEPAAN